MRWINFSRSCLTLGSRTTISCDLAPNQLLGQLVSISPSRSPLTEVPKLFGTSSISSTWRPMSFIKTRWKISRTITISPHGGTLWSTWSFLKSMALSMKHSKPLVMTMEWTTRAKLLIQITFTVDGAEASTPGYLQTTSILSTKDVGT